MMLPEAVNVLREAVGNIRYTEQNPALIRQATSAVLVDLYERLGRVEAKAQELDTRTVGSIMLGGPLNRGQ